MKVKVLSKVISRSLTNNLRLKTCSLFILFVLFVKLMFEGSESDLLGTVDAKIIENRLIMFWVSRDYIIPRH
jgi:hypothetical protein